MVPSVDLMLAVGKICRAHEAAFLCGWRDSLKLLARRLEKGIVFDKRRGPNRTFAGIHRAVAQLGRAPRSGRGGREFKSRRPDHPLEELGTNFSSCSHERMGASQTCRVTDVRCFGAVSSLLRNPFDGCS